MKFLEDERDVADIPVGYVWESRLIRAGLLRAILFALVTGDWNKIHINPLTFFFYKSNLGGLTCPGDMVLSLTKKGIHQVFDFKKDVEVIAFGYELVEFKRPLRVGSLFQYRYTLLSREIEKGVTRCRWRIEVVDERGKIISNAVWVNGYYPVNQTTVGKVSAQALVASKVAAQCLAVAALLTLIVGPLIFNYVPINEYNFPIAP